jgi:hypothetical protein
LTCSKCNEIKYDTRECQVADWKASHKILCSSFGVSGIPDQGQVAVSREQAVSSAKDAAKELDAACEAGDISSVLKLNFSYKSLNEALCSEQAKEQEGEHLNDAEKLHSAPMVSNQIDDDNFASAGEQAVEEVSEGLDHAVQPWATPAESKATATAALTGSEKAVGEMVSEQASDRARIAEEKLAEMEETLAMEKQASRNESRRLRESQNTQLEVSRVHASFAYEEGAQSRQHEIETALQANAALEATLARERQEAAKKLASGARQAEQLREAAETEMRQTRERSNKENKALQSRVDESQRRVQEQAEMEQQLRGLLVCAKEQTARIEEAAKVDQQTRWRLEGELAAVVSAVRQVPSMGDVELRDLEEAVLLRRQRLAMERMRADAQAEARRELEREREVMREARLCVICLDKPNDTAYGCGHQACAGCARELVDCHICRQAITIRTRLFF